MKKLLGFLFCIGFLLFAGTFEAKAQTEPIHLEAQVVLFFDIGKYTIDAPVISLTQSREHKLIDIGKLRDASAQAVIKTNYALSNRMRFILDCPVIYLHKHPEKLGYKYTYNYPKQVPRTIWLPYFNI